MILSTSEHLGLTGKELRKKATNEDRLAQALEQMAQALRALSVPTPQVKVTVPVPDVVVEAEPPKEFPREIVIDIDRDRTGRIERLRMKVMKD